MVAGASNVRATGVLRLRKLSLNDCNVYRMGEWSFLSAIGTVLRERYEIITELGKGGMSTVYLAKDKNLESYWAVKQVKNNTNVDIKAFKKEVELLSSLNHSDIPRIVDRIEITDNFFVIMDFIDGTSLGKKVAAEGPLPEEQVVEWAKMLCDVLDYLHTVKDNPIVYRDMKPDNIMLTQAGRIKLIDFGIAKECRRGEKQLTASIGTRGYAAPEQYKGASNILDERTDIYSLGASLFYLVTGMTPGKPPNGIRPVRQVNPLVSEGLEYIIAKCTEDVPEERYQNCRELREDLNNIQQLTGAYRKKMTRKLISFGGSLVLSLVCLIFVFAGYSGIQAEREDNYQAAFQTAVMYDRQGDFANAAKYYSKAIEYKADDIETYLLLFNALLPKSDANDRIAQTKFAIDEMRKGYIENPNSAMYRNSELMYQVVKKCIEVNDPAYAGFAFEYIEMVKNSRDYSAGTFSADEIDSYEIIAAGCAQNLATLDFQNFNRALLNLEENTDINILCKNEMLENYYIIMTMYTTYSGYLEDSYLRIYEVGTKAKAIIDSNLDSEDLTFNNIIPLYELVASSLYNSAIVATDVEEKREKYLSSIEWFRYLDDLNHDLTETLELRKGNAYKGIFDIYNTVEDRDKIDSTVTALLDEAIEVYKIIIDKNSSSFLAHVYLTQAYLDKELIKPRSARDFSDVEISYAKVVELKNIDGNLSIIALSQYSSLRSQMQNAGLEGR